jgi:hypothetical protein
MHEANAVFPIESPVFRMASSPLAVELLFGRTQSAIDGVAAGMLLNFGVAATT